MKQAKNRNSFHVRLPLEIDERLTKAAQKNDRSKNAQITTILKEWLQNEEKTKKH